MYGKLLKTLFLIGWLTACLTSNAQLTERQKQNIIILKNRLDSASVEAQLYHAKADTLQLMVTKQAQRIETNKTIIQVSNSIIEKKDLEIQTLIVLSDRQKKTISVQNMVIKVGVPAGIIIGFLGGYLIRVSPY